MGNEVEARADVDLEQYDDFAALVGLITGVLTLMVAALLAVFVMKAPTTSPELEAHREKTQKSMNKGKKKNDAKVKVWSVAELSAEVQQGAIAFLKTEYTILAVFCFVSFFVIGGVNFERHSKFEGALAFLVGATFSGCTGWAGMIIATYANVRTAVACSIDLPTGLRVAFRAGAVMGLSVVGTGLIGVCALYLLVPDMDSLAGFGMGASAVALFARVGGGIYTKAADVGADLVGKVRNDLPEDDIRNAGVIADNVGDNVGDVAGMGADLFESFVGSIIASATLGKDVLGPVGVALPIWLAVIGVVCSIIGIFAVRTKDGANLESLLWSIRFGILFAGVLVIGGAAVLTHLLETSWYYFGCIIVGLVVGIAFGFFTEYTTAYTYEPVRSISRAGAAGPAPVVIQGLGVGLLSTMPPVILISAGILVCYEFGDQADPEQEIFGFYKRGGGAFGVALSSVGMLATLGVTLATDAYGPVADNAGGLAEMAMLDSSVRDNTDRLDSLGNTTAATGKGFAIGSGVLTAIALMIAFTGAVELQRMDLIRDAKFLFPGFLVGSMAPFVFAALTMLSVRKSAMMIMHVVDKELEDEAIMNFTKNADFAQCVKIATVASVKEMVLPGVLGLSLPFIIGIGLGPVALGGMLLGAIGSGFLLAVTMANAGGAWDNAKKWVKAEACDGGKAADLAALIDPVKGKAYKDVSDAVIAGDTVGDPFKDTSGPALNILFKLMSMVSLVMAPAFKQEFHDDYWYIAIIIIVVTGFGSMAWYVYLDQQYKTLNEDFGTKATGGAAAENNEDEEEEEEEEEDEESAEDEEEDSDEDST